MLAYSEQCENEATHTLEWMIDETYNSEPMCEYHAKSECEKIKYVDGLAVVTLGTEE
jgi:hypothetical protein